MTMSTLLGLNPIAGGPDWHVGEYSSSLSAWATSRGPLTDPIAAEVLRQKAGSLEVM